MTGKHLSIIFTWSKLEVARGGNWQHRGKRSDFTRQSNPIFVQYCQVAQNSCSFNIKCSGAAALGYLFTGHSHKSPKSHRVVIWTEKWTRSNKLRMGHLSIWIHIKLLAKNLSVPPFQLPSVGSPLKAQQWPPRHSGNQGSPQICPFSSPGRPDSICSTQGVVSDLC